jgi:group I intron endonuclease
MEIQPKQFFIYKHTLNGKSYIGFTGQTVEKRLAEHLKLAESGSDYYWHRAIRKHGANNIITEVLDTCDTKKQALKLEIHYIKVHNTLYCYNGYNLTEGGEGGNICNNLPPEKKEEYLKKRSKATTGENNPMYSGLSNQELIEAAVEMFKEHKVFYRRLWMKEGKLKGYPQSFSKNRFDGKFSIFMEMVKKEAESQGLDTANFGRYVMSESHKNTLSECVSDSVWYTDGINTIKLKATDTPPKGYKRGRTIIKEF